MSEPGAPAIVARALSPEAAAGEALAERSAESATVLSPGPHARTDRITPAPVKFVM
jgi:hypothetical protein